MVLCPGNFGMVDHDDYDLVMWYCDIVMAMMRLRGIVSRGNELILRFH